MYRLIFFLVLALASSEIKALSIRDDFEDKDNIKKNTIYIAYIEDSITHRKSFSRLVNDFNIQNTKYHVEISMFENEDHFISTSRGSEFVHQFDLILTDIVMNENFSGFLVAQHLSEKKFQNPIIAVTSDYERLSEYYRSKDLNSSYNIHDPDASLFDEILPKLTRHSFSSLIEKFITRHLNKSVSDQTNLKNISKSRSSFYISESLSGPVSSRHSRHKFTNRIHLPQDKFRSSGKIRRPEMGAQSHLLQQEIRSHRTFFCFCSPFFMSVHPFKNNKVHVLR